MELEKVTNLDELKALGYFETIKSTFFLKVIFLVNHLENNRIQLDISREIESELVKLDEFPLFKTALKNGNEELVKNFNEDIVTTLLISSWIAFELIIKDLTNTNYALSTNDISADYHRKSFGLSKREKKNLDLFYYLRNAIVHYNGAYFSYREIDHVYEGIHFVSKGKEGEKVLIPNMITAYKIHCDIEKYAYKAWDNHKKTIFK